MRCVFNQAFRWFAFFCLISVFAAPSSHAQPQPDMHTQSAFLFADRKEWAEATLHAQASGNRILQKFIAWLSYQDPQSGADFAEITRFIRQNPTWPQQERLKLRAEQAIRADAVSDAQLQAWFEKNPPISGAGKMALAEMNLRAHPNDAGAVLPLIREGWRDGDFDESREKHILSRYGNYLHNEDHFARTDRLLWERKINVAERMRDLLSPEQKAWAKARIALIQNKTTAPFAALRVNKPYYNNPGLLYNRIMWRAERNDDKGVRELLLAAPRKVPYPEKWWRIRESQIRKAVDEQNYLLARKLLANHGQEDGPEFADALWLSGWVELEYLNQPQEAYAHFYAMYDAVSYPVSKARAAYWAGRAAKKAGDMNAARSWFNTASSYPSTFYGQLAANTLSGNAPLKLPSDPIAPRESLETFNNNELVQAIKLCIRNSQDNLATQLVTHLIDNAGTPHEMAMAALLVRNLQSTALGVRAAKRALQKGTLLLETGFPLPRLSSTLAVEPALAYAIARQESEFDEHARSRANALGYMQLLPSTAREVARKNDLPYAESRLFEPAYNTQLGSLYLGKLIQLYDGSYIKSIAAYNAGPGNMRNWLLSIGQPGKTTDDAVNWIEKIPFHETRNYVQRVLENLQVYRYLLSQEQFPGLHLEEDLTR